MAEQTEYAFGANEVDGCACPVVAAKGSFPDAKEHGTARHVAEQYDDMVAARMDEQDGGLLVSEVGGRRGVVTADIAREAWEQALARCEEWAETNMFYESAVEDGEEVAETLGWD